MPQYTILLRLMPQYTILLRLMPQYTILLRLLPRQTPMRLPPPLHAAHTPMCCAMCGGAIIAVFSATETSTPRKTLWQFMRPGNSALATSLAVRT
jgi:hypothetical protein